jgi:hypothetical protein
VPHAPSRRATAPPLSAPPSCQSRRFTARGCYPRRPGGSPVPAPAPSRQKIRRRACPATAPSRQKIRRRACPASAPSRQKRRRRACPFAAPPRHLSPLSPAAKAGASTLPLAPQRRSLRLSGSHTCTSPNSLHSPALSSVVEPPRRPLRPGSSPCLRYSKPAERIRPSAHASPSSPARAAPLQANLPVPIRRAALLDPVARAAPALRLNSPHCRVSDPALLWGPLQGCRGRQCCSPPPSPPPAEPHRPSPRLLYGAHKAEGAYTRK